MLDYKKLLSTAVRLASTAHAHDVDKGGTPYIGHVLSVSSRCVTDEAKITAILHDVIEDTWMEEKDLEKDDIPREVIDAVVLLTRKKGDDYYEYVKRIKANPIAREVKIHDLEDNLNLLRLNRLLEAKDLDRINKYIKCYRYLVSDDNEFDI